MQDKDVIIWKKKKISLSAQCSPWSSVSFTVWWERSGDCLVIVHFQTRLSAISSYLEMELPFIQFCQCMTRVGSKTPMLLNSWGPSSPNTSTLVRSAQSSSCSVLSLLFYPSSSFFLVSNCAIMFGVSETHGLFITFSLIIFGDLCFTSVGVRSGTSPQYSCLENAMDRGTWRATVHGVKKRGTRLSPWANTHTLPL